ncbi:MAG: hypothetical protein ABI415_03400 [Flavitalea sp.]
MKTTASILLLLLLAFNWVGYRLLSVYLESRSDVALETKIDNSDYDESQLIELRVPLFAPYFSGNSTQFETIHGELELSGVHYKYVKRKIENGEVVLLCLPNEDKSKFQNSRADFFKLVNDLNNSSTHGKDKNAGSAKTFISDYTPENNFLNLSLMQTAASKFLVSRNSFRQAGHLSILKRPPRA